MDFDLFIFYFGVKHKNNLEPNMCQNRFLGFDKQELLMTYLISSTSPLLVLGWLKVIGATPKSQVFDIIKLQTLELLDTRSVWDWFLDPEFGNLHNCIMMAVFWSMGRDRVTLSCHSSGAVAWLYFICSYVYWWVIRFAWLMHSPRWVSVWGDH